MLHRLKRLSLCRVEHEAFTDRDTQAFKQLVRVVIRDFLPFIKRVFANLYSDAKVEQLALSTPCALWHQGSAAPPSLSVATPSASKVAVDLNMRLDMGEIGEPLRNVAPDVFEELEMAQRRHQEEQLLTVSMEERKGREAVTEGEEEEGGSPQDGLEGREAELESGAPETVEQKLEPL